MYSKISKVTLVTIIFLLATSAFGRYYDAGIGRFLVPDPLAHLHPEINPYHYCFNNPLRFIDPDGLDTLNVNLLTDRNQEGTMSLTVNGQSIALPGGNQVLGRGITNGGLNPTRDPMQEFGDTPIGTATVTTVLDRDPNGTFVNTNGTPVENAQGTPSDQLIAQGRYFILLNPESGQIQESGRTELGGHGGGTSLGINALQAQQTLVTSRGCLRWTNQTAAQLGQQINDANQNNRVFRVIITERLTPMQHMINAIRTGNMP